MPFQDLPPDTLYQRALECRTYPRHATNMVRERKRFCPKCGGKSKVVTDIGCVVCEARKWREEHGLPD